RPDDYQDPAGDRLSARGRCRKRGGIGERPRLKDGHGRAVCRAGYQFCLALAVQAPPQRSQRPELKRFHGALATAEYPGDRRNIKVFHEAEQYYLFLRLRQLRERPAYRAVVQGALDGRVRWSGGGDDVIHQPFLTPPDVSPPDVDESVASYPEHPGREGCSSRVIARNRLEDA